MKKAVLLFALLALVSGAALAHGGGRVQFGLHFGFPLYPYYYAPPVYYPPAYYPAYPVTVAPPAPPVYVERDDVAPDASVNWWYYCEQTRGYYPYVKTCPGGWQRVPPAPPPAR